MRNSREIVTTAALIIFCLSVQGSAQIRSTRSNPRYRPILPVPIGIRMRMPMQPQLSASRLIREYPSSPRRIISLPAKSISGNGNGDYETRIQSLETRLDDLESLASDLKDKLNNIPAQGGMSDEKFQRLLKVEEDMKSLKGLLVELRDYLKGKR
jgi:hypothetical protein